MDSSVFVDSFAEGLLAAAFVGSMMELPLMAIPPAEAKQLPVIEKLFLAAAAAVVAVVGAATVVVVATAVGVVEVVVVAAAAADSYKDSSLPSALVDP